MNEKNDAVPSNFAEVNVSDVSEKYDNSMNDSLEKDVLNDVFDEKSIPTGKTLQQDELDELNEIERSREEDGDGNLEVVSDDLPFGEMIMNFEKHVEDQHKELVELQNRPSFKDSNVPSINSVSQLQVSQIEESKKYHNFREAENQEAKDILSELSRNLSTGEESLESLLPDSNEPSNSPNMHEIEEIEDSGEEQENQDRDRHGDILEIRQIPKYKSKTDPNSIHLPRNLFNEYQAIGNLFLESGFDNVLLPSQNAPLTASNFGKLMKNIKQLFLDYRKRGRFADSLDSKRSPEVDHLIRKNQQLETEIKAKQGFHKNRVDRMNQKLIHLQMTVKNEKKKSFTESKKLSGEISRLRKSLQLMRVKYQKSSHNLKKEEIRTVKLENEISRIQKNHATSLRKAEQLFSQYYKKRPRSKDVNDRKEVEIVRFLNHKLQNTQKHVRFLEQKISSQKGKGGYVQSISPSHFGNQKNRLSSSPFQVSSRRNQGSITFTRPDLDRSSNETPSPPTPPNESSSTKNKSKLIEDSNDLRKMSETISSLRMELASLQDDRRSQVNFLQEKLRTSMGRIQDIESENQEMVREIQGRPTLDMFESLQSKYDHLLHQMKHTNFERKKDFADLDISKSDLQKERKYMKDQTAKKIVLRVLEIMQLERTGDIIPTLKKTCSLVQAIPRLREFVYSVLKVVREGQKLVGQQKREKIREEKSGGSEDTQFLQVAPKDVNSKLVPGILESWVGLILELHGYRDLESKIIHLLSKLEKTEKLRNELGNDFQSFQYLSSDYSHEIVKKKMLSILHCLVETSNRSKSVDETFKFLEQCKKNGGKYGKMYFSSSEKSNNVETSSIFGSLIEHFMKLFEISSMNGVLPKMNHLYRSTNEIRNMLNVLREIFQLPSNCGLKDIIQYAKKMNGDLCGGIVQL